MCLCSVIAHKILLIRVCFVSVCATRTVTNRHPDHEKHVLIMHTYTHITDGNGETTNWLQNRP